MNKGIALVTVTNIEVKQLQGGSTLGILRGTIANQSKDNATSQWVDDPIAVEFSGFDNKYRNIASEIGKLRQGQLVLVEYKLNQNKWIDKRTNQERHGVKFGAEAIHAFGQAPSQPAPRQQPQQSQNDMSNMPF